MKLVFKFLWLDSVIAFSLDQSIGNKYIPLTDFYFWPQVDAWEKMKVFLESQPFITKEETVVLLNFLTEVINMWQDRYNLKLDVLSLRSKFPDIRFMVN
jgi:hypothetical protein